MVSKINLLQKQKLDLQIKLNELMHTSNKDQDKINEIKSEILYLDKQIEKIVGKKEIKRQYELKKKKSGIDETNINNYYSFKSKVESISPMNRATARIISIIEKRQITEERIKVKVA